MAEPLLFRTRYETGLAASRMVVISIRMGLPEYQRFSPFLCQRHVKENCRRAGYSLVPRRAWRQVCILTILPERGQEDRPRLSMRPCAASKFHLQYR